jgi:hypothetical protein
MPHPLRTTVGPLFPAFHGLQVDEVHVEMASLCEGARRVRETL